MNEIMVKSFENTEVEIIELDGEPMFEIYSTGMALGQIKNNAIGKAYPRKERIEENIKSAEIIPCVHNGHSYISESQLYDLMLEMKTDKVRPFRKWITNEVLPTIRKTGGYVVEDREAEFITNYFPSFTDETKLVMIQDLRCKNKQLREAIKEKDLHIESQRRKIEDQKPAVLFTETVTKSCDNILIRQMAKLLCEQHINIGEKRLYKLLRNKEILMSDNEPYQSYIDRGYFTVKESTYNTPYGEKLNRTTLVTPKGQIWIVSKVKNWQETESA